MTISFQTAEKRWATLGPYYAMFPLDFVNEVIEKYSSPGQSVLDPFVGRGSSVFIAATSGRQGVGIEINPVGWLFGKVKLAPGPERLVVKRLKEIAAMNPKGKTNISKRSREFFDSCFCKSVLSFLINARDNLNWKTSKVDASLMAIILVYLHGKIKESLSNQLRQGKAMSPDYSVRWWKKNKYKSPEIDPVEFLNKRISWRYAKGVPSTNTSYMLLGDSTRKIKMVERLIAKRKIPKFSLLFTSPPYNGVTNYHYDQWLRLWMLGGPDYPVRTGDYSRGKFVGRESYKSLLKNAFIGCSNIMKKSAIIYVRTDARQFTFKTTLNVLSSTFPKKDIELIKRPYLKKTQTSLYGDHGDKPGEIDIILQ